MPVQVEVLYAPTCANSIMWLNKIRKALDEFGASVCLKEIDVTEYPEVLGRYSSKVWQEFNNGYTHYLTAVAVDGKLLEDWYWDTQKIAEEVKRRLKM